MFYRRKYKELVKDYNQLLKDYELLIKKNHLFSRIAEAKQNFIKNHPRKKKLTLAISPSVYSELRCDYLFLNSVMYGANSAEVILEMKLKIDDTIEGWYIK